MKLAAHAWPGGYPLVYTDPTTENRLCPECANDRGLANRDGDVHWEGPPERCDECGAEIESAYGDPDAKTGEGDDDA